MILVDAWKVDGVGEVDRGVRRGVFIFIDILYIMDRLRFSRVNQVSSTVTG